MTRPDADLAGAVRAHRVLLDALGGMTDADALRPSLLPGWSVGHVLTHLARNADGLTRILEAARRGEVAHMYEGGTEGRAAAIEAGAARPTGELVEDVAGSSRRLEAAWGAVPGQTWVGEGRMWAGVLPIREVGFMRWREVVVHHADLGLGYSFADWPDDYLTADLARCIADLPDRLPAGLALILVATDTGETWTVTPGAECPVRVEADRHHLLAWILGRLVEPSWPALAPWRPVPSKP